MSQYEVWCHSCDVTFAPEQKRCLHCGGRTRPEVPSYGKHRILDAEPLPFSQELFKSEASTVTATPDLPFAADPVEAEGEPARRSLLRAGMTVVWMVLLAGGYAWRACSQ